MREPLRQTATAPASGRGQVVIGIPTYRRDLKLERLLQSLMPSLAASRAIVIVADNASSDMTRALIERVADASGHDLRYLAVTQRGISANRNALIDAFLALEPTSDWLAMLDDDLSVPTNWLELMVTTGVSSDADIVGAPYSMARPTGHFIIDNSIFLQRPRRTSGPTSPIHAAGNVLLSRRLLAEHASLRFDDEYGLSGGEDYDFFGRAARLGARFAWCDEAFAVEDVDTDRLTNGAVFYRYYSSGNYMFSIDRARLGRGAALKGSATTLLGAISALVTGMAKADRKRMLLGMFRGLIVAGGLAASIGHRVYRYK